MADIDLNLYSLNCNGLRDRVKHTAVMAKLKKYNPGLFLLQETHSTTDIETDWRLQWGSNYVYFSHGSSSSKGVAILIHPKYDIHVLNVITDNDGRYIILEIERCGVKYTVGNVYVRNFEKEQRDVFTRFVKHIDELENEHVIIGGDYNLYLKPRLNKLDDMGDHGDNMSFRIDVESYLETNNMSDVWRTLNPDKRLFTWHRGNKRARLGYFFLLRNIY